MELTENRKVNEEYFKVIDTPEKAYWLGFVCSDGHITPSEGKTVLSSKDPEVLEKFRDAIQSEHAITILGNTPDKRTGKTYRSYALQVTNSKFTSWVVHKGITSEKSTNVSFPDIDEELYSYFIAGLFDGDGSLSRRDGKVRVNLISTKEMLAYIQNYLYTRFTISVGVLSKVSLKVNNVYKMYLYKDAIKFLDFLYEDSDRKELYLSRKYKRYEQYKKDMLR